MSDETPKLLPCPFCGSSSAPALAHLGGDAVIACYGSKGGCGARAEAIDSDEPTCEHDAIEAWNRRTAPAAPQVGEPKTWTLVLNEYQRNNLLLLLNACGYPYRNPHVVEGLPSFDTGDWLGEVTNMLGGTLEPGAQTNTTAQRWRDEIRAAAAAAAAPAAPQVVADPDPHAPYICMGCAHVFEKCPDFDAYNCPLCGEKIRPKKLSLGGAPQGVDRDGVREAGRAVVAEWEAQAGRFYEALGDDNPRLEAVATQMDALARALKATPPPAAAPPTSRELTCEDVGCPKCCPPTPSAPPPTGERTAGEERADVVAYLRKCSAAFAAEDSMEFVIRSIERGDHIGSSRSPAGTGK